MATCSISGCSSAAASRGWCIKHYTRWQRHGDPEFTTRTPPSTATAVEKFCPRCHTVKAIDEFGRRPNGNPKGYCKPCEAKYQADHASTVAGREMRRRARGKWNDGNHGYFLSYRYGITSDDYDRMLAEQGGCCAICQTDKPGGKARAWSVDHCHSTNKVRGLLCHRCNVGLGYFKDDPVRMARAISYLEHD
jgi:hypothetical protein